MSRLGNCVLVALMAMFLVVQVGCVAPVVETAETDASSESADEQAEIAEALAALSEEDRAAAEKQKICPVGGGALGSMDTPVKVDLNGKTVFICCEGCEDVLKADPEKYLAKLDQGEAEN